jgi:hypothetical protein
VIWDDGDRPLGVTFNQIQPRTGEHRSTGHAAIGPLVALMGGWVASRMFRRDGEPPWSEETADK